MKTKRSEDLYLHLTKIDNSLLKEAADTDTEAKLTAINKGTTAAESKPHRRAKILRLTGILAACLAVVLVTALWAVPAMLGKKDPSVPGPDPSPVTPVGEIHIDSLDAFNYYFAKTMLAEAGNTTEKLTLSMDDAPVFRLLADNDEELNPKEEKPVESQNEDDNPDAPTQGQEPDDNIFYDEEKGYYYYEFDPAQSLTVTRIIAFRIRLTDPNGFLAKKLGTGEIEVIVTDNSFEDMITFRSQDGKYYSCLWFDGDADSIVYSNHKYTEGFRVVKNFTQENYTFDIQLENGQVNGFLCRYLEDISANATESEPDTVEFVEGSSEIVTVERTITIAELEGLVSNPNA